MWLLIVNCHKQYKLVFIFYIFDKFLEFKSTYTHIQTDKHPHTHTRTHTCICPIIIICSLLRVFFPASVSWWFLTGVWVIASLLKSPELFSVFLSISIMVYFEQAPLVLLFPSPPVLVLIIWWLFQEHQSQLVLSWLSCSTILLLLLLFSPLEFFTSALADGPSLEFEKVSSSFQDSSQYFCRSQ